MAAYAEIDADIFATLPAALHYRGEPNEWVRMTRPGHAAALVPRGTVFDDDGATLVRRRAVRAHLPHRRAGDWTLAHAGDGQPHGLARMDAGMFAVADYRLGLMRFDAASGTMTPICEGVNVERFRGLGDITRAPNGDLWFTDPGRSSLSDPTGRVFRLRSGARTPSSCSPTFPIRTASAFSPDGRFVYVAATRANAVWRLLADAPDPVYPMVGMWVQLSGGLGPDGIAVHAERLRRRRAGQAGRACGVRSARRSDRARAHARRHVDDVGRVASGRSPARHRRCTDRTIYCRLSRLLRRDLTHVTT